MSIAPVSQAVHPSSPCRTPAAPAAAAPQSGTSPDELRAEDTAVRSSVGALRNYAAQFTATPPLATTPSAPTAPTNPAAPVGAVPPLTGSTGSSSSSPFAPARTWASMVGQSGPGGATAGSAADQGMSQILDDGDVFGADGD